VLSDEILQSVRQAVDDVLTSDLYRNYLGQYCDRLAGMLCQCFSASDALLTSSGSAALELALRAAGVGPGDEVLLSAYDYPGNFWAIERSGARPVLVDLEENGWRIDQTALLQGWQDDSSHTIKALVVSHLHGQLQPISELRRWCDQQGIMLIEDACQAVGASIEGDSVGSFGHASIVSFGGGKVLSCGRGGALMTNDPQLAQRARIAAGVGSGPYTMSELQAAVVVAQFPWLERVNAECRQYFTQVAQALTSAAVTSPYTSSANGVQQNAFYQAGFLLSGDSGARRGESASDSGAALTANLQYDSRANDSAMLAGWQSRVVGELKVRGVAAGVGFAGFHRRSARRCRTWTPLLHAAAIAAGTITIHHREALTARFSPQQLADLIAITVRPRA